MDPSFLEMEVFENQKICLTPGRLTLHAVGLRAVKACTESDSVQC